MMVDGLERLQNAAHQREVSMIIIVQFTNFLANIIHSTVTCPKLIAPEYGRVSVSGYAYSSTAYYSCDYGYDLDGSHSRKCQHDGTWYGKAPECRPAKRSK